VRGWSHLLKPASISLLFFLLSAMAFAAAPDSLTKAVPASRMKELRWLFPPLPLELALRGIPSVHDWLKAESLICIMVSGPAIVMAANFLRLF